MRKCGNCGKEYEGRYCPECGEEWLEEMECRQCGAKLSGSAKFCTECGYSLGKSGKVKKSGTGAGIGEWFKNAGRWIKSHLKIVIPVASALVMIITVSCVLTSVLSNKFRVGKVSKIEIGYTQEQVLEILGEPYEDTKEDYKWEYYDGKCNGILEKLSANSKAQEKALLADDESKLEKLMEEELKLTEQLEGVTCKYIEVNFAPNLNVENKTVYTVSSVLFDTAHKYGEENADKKQLEEVKLSKDSAYFFENLSNLKLSCEYYYGDGSYRRSVLPQTVTEKIINGEQNIEWQDKWGKYSRTFDFKILNSISGKANGGIKWELTYEENGVVTDFHGFSIDDYLHYLNEYENAYYLGTKENPYIMLYAVKNKDLTDIKINNQCCIIGGFYDCENLKEISIPENVSIIRRDAFRNCKSLTSITIPDGVKSIWSETFEYCKSLKEVVIPDGVTKIDYEAFYGCGSLISVTIPVSVTEISREAFAFCNSKIDFVYGGTMEQWRSIKLDTSNSNANWAYGTRDYIIHCTDGDITESDMNN